MVYQINLLPLEKPLWESAPVTFSTRKTHAKRERAEEPDYYSGWIEHLPKLFKEEECFKEGEPANSQHILFTINEKER